MVKKNKKRQAIKKWIKEYCQNMTWAANLKREHIIVGTIIVFVLAIIGISLFSMFKINDEQYWLMKAAYDRSEEMSEQEIYEEVKSIQESIDTTNWKKYQSNWYGFFLKYPESFKYPVTRNATAGSNWEYRYEFRKQEVGDDLFTGFDLTVYSVKKVKELTSVNEFPVIKSEELKEDPWCQNIIGRIVETGDYPAEEIYISPTDRCYNPTLFFTFTRDNYIYVLIPTVQEGSKISGDPRVEINDHFSDFLGMISTAKLVDIRRPKPKPAAVINAPRPVSYKVKDGKLVCARKNDKPSKSKKDKGKHLDMECCLDPDEYPNPHCYYDPDKYGKYLD